MAREMTWNYNDFFRYLTLEALNSTYYNELFGLPLPYQVPIVPDYGSFPESPMKAETNFNDNTQMVSDLSNFLSGIQQIDSERIVIENQKNEIIGSNNWVVNGTKTSTGAPILCNDMHLAWLMPGVWYEQHLKAMILLVGVLLIQVMMFLIGIIIIQMVKIIIFIIILQQLIHIKLLQLT
jgi:penicillin amidase